MSGFNFNLNSVTLNHYSDKELKFNNRIYEQPNIATFKPRGFWLSFNDQWLRWCVKEEFNLEKIKYRTEFKIRSIKNFVILDNPDVCIQFQNDYGENNYINWNDVAKDYDGIIFTYGILTNDNRKYQIWDMTVWLSWDIESVCVWNTGLLKPVKTYPVFI